MTKSFYVYIHCKPNGDPFYVGKGHGKRAKLLAFRNSHHARIVKKYGSGRIEVFVFPCASEQQALQDECQHIAQLRADGYELANVTNGGEGVSGLRHSAESKAKMAVAKTGRPLSEVHREKLSLALQGKQQHWAGKSHSDETRKKMSAMRAGRPGRIPTVEQRQTLAASHLGQVPWNKGLPSPLRGVPRSEEVCAKLSAANKGKRLTAEHRKKLSDAKKGSVLSAEHRAKVAQGLRSFHQSKKSAESANGELHGQ